METALPNVATDELETLLKFCSLVAFERQLNHPDAARWSQIVETAAVSVLRRRDDVEEREGARRKGMVDDHGARVNVISPEYYLSRWCYNVLCAFMCRAIKSDEARPGEIYDLCVCPALCPLTSFLHLPFLFFLPHCSRGNTWCSTNIWHWFSNNSMLKSAGGDPALRVGRYRLIRIVIGKGTAGIETSLLASPRNTVTKHCRRLSDPDLSPSASHVISAPDRSYLCHFILCASHSRLASVVVFNLSTASGVSLPGFVVCCSSCTAKSCFFLWPDFVQNIKM